MSCLLAQMISTSLDELDLVSSSMDESLAEQDNDVPLLLPSTDNVNINDDDDKTLHDVLTSLDSTKVRCMHKYTDDQLTFMHKHNEFNRMLQSFVDVTIFNGHVGRQYARLRSISSILCQ
jgi:hypothetical protein